MSSTVTLPTLTLALVDAAGTATNSVSASGLVSAKATVKDATGKVVAGTKVTFSGDVLLIKISPSADVLTDASGVATVQISTASLSAAGAGTLSASALVAGISPKATIDYQLSPANVTLTGLDVGASLGPLAAFGNRPLSVVANINGVPAAGTPIQVSFLASCGTVNPATVTTDGSGKASTTYTANNVNCAGSSVKITVNSLGVATPLEGTVAVAAIQATNLQFVSANPTLIYLQNSGAATQSVVTFKVLDASGNPVQNQRVNLALLNAATAAGLSIDALGNSASVVKTTDVLGQVSVAVFSGNVPTAVQVTAKLDAPSNVQTNSNILTVASGKAVQKSASLALEKFSIEGLNIDGATSDVTLSVADRQGNPVPDGTEINFVAEGGVMIPARCVVAGGTSQCKSTFRSSGTRPANGRISILAYLPGEKDFVDANFNNQYDPGETFTDMGNAYRDDDEAQSGGSAYTSIGSVFKTGYFSVPRAGTSSCNPVGGAGDGTGSSGYNGRPGTCDGVWGATEVRRQVVIVLATGTAVISPLSTTSGALRVSVTDLNGNSMPTGTTITAKNPVTLSTCLVSSVVPAIITNRYGSQDVSIELDSCTAGSPAVPGVAAVVGPPAVAAIPPVPAVPADRISVTVTSPSGVATVRTITLTP